VSARYERASLIVTPKALRPLGETFGDAVVSAAMIDRLVHQAEVVTSKATATGSRTATSGGAHR
jgi:DNA replication protein DnaC